MIGSCPPLLSQTLKDKIVYENRSDEGGTRDIICRFFGLISAFRTTGSMKPQKASDERRIGISGLWAQPTAQIYLSLILAEVFCPLIHA